jgi:hypothetical protein
MIKRKHYAHYYNFKASAIKSKLMAFVGEYSVRSKIIVNNAILEKVTKFYYLVCSVTYNYDEDVNRKLNNFQNIMWNYFKSTKERD